MLSTVCLQFGNEKAAEEAVITERQCLGTQLLFYLPKMENPEVLSDFFCHDLNVFRTVVMLWPIVFLLPNWENHEKDHNVKLCTHALLSQDE